MGVLHDFGPLLPPVTGQEQWRFTPRQRFAALFEPGGAAELAAGLAAGAEQAGESTKRLSVAAGAAPPEPLTVELDGQGPARRLIEVDLGADSEASVVLDLTGGGARVVDLAIRLGDRGRAVVAIIGDWENSAVRLVRIHIAVGTDSQFVGCTSLVGGGAARLVTNVEFAGPGGSVELLGASLTGAGEHHQHRLLIDHTEPGCRSYVEYKSVLHGEGAHGVWVGDVRIRPRAKGTETYEISRNLLLTRGTRADSVPNLEIETGDVTKAGHASATGRFDDEQLFYLRSRGLDDDSARALVVRGFLSGVFERLPDSRVRGLIWQRIETRLAGIAGAESSTPKGEGEEREQ
ncbi:MAG: SufD family Fe-S cluster assembly protein [Candidatus Nanopelagicales bacterium]|nr:SufD family Fe-S cluster assembly protein [Candidatus Nanopelagicales bacterium]